MEYDNSNPDTIASDVNEEVNFAAKELEEEDTPQVSNKKEENRNNEGEKNDTTGIAHNPIPPQAHKDEHKQSRTGIMENDFVFICKFMIIHQNVAIEVTAMVLFI